MLASAALWADRQPPADRGETMTFTVRALLRGLGSRSVRRPVIGGLALVLGATLVAVAYGLLGRVPDGREAYCEVARASFERTSKWARELAGTLEALNSDGPDLTATRLVAIHQGLAQEASLLSSHAPPAGAEEVRDHGTATLSLLMRVADPALVRTDDEAREQVAEFVREQFLSARGEARAAAAALRQHEPNCPTRRSNGGILQLLGFGT